MRLELTARHIVITPAIRRLVQKRLAPTLRMLNDSAVSAQVVLTQEKTRCRAEVTLHARGEHFLHGNGLGRDVATALAVAAEKIDRQAQRLKGKWDTRRKSGPAREALVEPAAFAAPAPGDAQEVRVIRARRYAVKPMSIDEAALAVGNSTDAFLVFRNVTTDAVSVLFRRPDGHLGLIEPEA